MAAGDITKMLTSIVREDLPDPMNKLLKNNDMIHNRLLRWEKHMASRYEVIRGVVSVSVAQAEAPSVNLNEYIYGENDDQKIYRVIDIVNPSAIEQDLICTIDDYEKKLVFSCSDGVVNAFTLKLMTVLSLPEGHTISDSVDPVIPEEFHELLTDYVLSQLDNRTGRIPTARKREDIDADVQQQSEILWTTNKIIPSPFSISQIW